MGEEKPDLCHLEDEIANLNRIAKTLLRKELRNDWNEENPEIQELVHYTSRLDIGLSNYQKTIEAYADRLESDIVRQHAFIEEMEKYADRLEEGIIQKKKSTETPEEYGARLAIGVAKTQEYALEMEEYVNVLEINVAERMMELAEIGQAVASLSHCIKNIVNNLKAGSYIIDKGLKTDNHEFVKKGWDMIGRNIDRMTTLALDILAYSKNRTPDCEEVNIQTLILEVCETFSEKAKAMNVAITTEFDKDLTVVQLEQKGIHRVLMNFVSNGIDACEEMDKGEVVIKTELDKNTGFFTVTFTDNGCGMDDETKEKLFNSFFSTKGSRGTGLGLPTSYKIIREHGGSIAVVSELGKGTTFTMELPVAPKEPTLTAEKELCQER